MLGRDVHWHVSAKRLSKAVAKRGGRQLFVVNRVGILLPLRSTSLDELRRRGGVACLRGRVIRLTRPPRATKTRKARVKKGSPAEKEARKSEASGSAERQAHKKKPKPTLPEFAVLVRELSRRRK